MLSHLLLTLTVAAQDSTFAVCTAHPRGSTGETQWARREIASTDSEPARQRRRRERELALIYAPILRFANGERYFPTMPILTAFDGRINSVPGTPPPDGGPRDFGNLTELAPTTDSAHLSWNWLHRFYAPDLPWKGLELVSLAARIARDTIVPPPVMPPEVQARLDTLRQLMRDALAEQVDTAPVLRGHADAGKKKKEIAALSREIEVAESVTATQDAIDSLRALTGALNAALAGLTDQRRPPAGSPVLSALQRSLVFYRVCDLSQKESSHIWRYLRSDEQAWKRFHGKDLESGSEKDTAFKNEARKHGAFRVVQYYMYYLRDAGLQGHEQDLEMVYVFMPKQADAFGGLTIIVGSGHSSRTPNNVLVLTAQDLAHGRAIRSPEKSYGRRPPEESLNIQVELGGHSSATDVSPFGIFTPGVDVNWHIYHVWGTRDVQAVGGTGYYGPFRQEMNFERDLRSALTLFPPAEGYEETGPDPNRSRYLLTPVDDIRAMVVASQDTTGTADTTFEAFVESRIVPDFAPWGFTGFTGGHVSVDTVRSAMRLWSKAMALDPQGTDLLARDSTPSHSSAGTLEAKRHLPWLHDQYLSDPTTIFKERLFRPTARGISDFPDALNLLTWGVTFHPSAAVEPHLGFIIPAVTLPVRFPGFLEVQSGVYRPRMFGSERPSFAAALVWQHSYDGYVSWYQRLSFVPHRESSLAVDGASDWTLGTGVSILPKLSRKSGFALFNAFRLGLGIHVDLKPWPDAFRRAGWELTLDFRQ